MRLNKYRKAEIRIFPNPVSDWLTVSFEAIPGRKEVSILQSSGQRISDQNVSGDEAKFYMGEYITGVYLIKVKSEGSVKFIRFVKH